MGQADLYWANIKFLQELSEDPSSKLTINEKCRNKESNLEVKLKNTREGIYKRDDLADKGENPDEVTTLTSDVTREVRMLY